MQIAQIAAAGVSLGEIDFNRRSAPLGPDRLPPFQEEPFYLVGGALRRWSGECEMVESPLTVDQSRVPLGFYPRLSASEAVLAVNAAVSAYDSGLGEWPMMNPEGRIEKVSRFLDMMKEKREQVVEFLMWEVGKPLDSARAEFDRTVRYIEDSIAALREIEREGQAVRREEGTSACISRAPRGVVFCTGPFNYPLNETFTTMIPALLMGNTVVMKPPKQGVLLFSPLLDAFRSCFPPGAVNIITGDGAELVTPIMQSGKVDVLAFIGSERVADIVIKAHPEPHRLIKILGLGAKNPGIVLPDANLDRAVAECVRGALTFNGQRCTALKILFVHRSVADEFVSRLAAAAAELPAGLPWQPEVAITPLAEPNKVKWMQEYIEDAAASGARIINPGGGAARGNLMTPAVLFPVGPQAHIFREEQFGPVVPVVPYDSLDEVLGYLKQSRARQQVSLFGEAQSVRGSDLVKRLERLYARVNLNVQCNRGPDGLPFTAKGSGGLGTLSIKDALSAFSLETVRAWRS